MLQFMGSQGVTRDGSPRGSPVPGILQARILEWGAIAFSITVYTTYQYILNYLHQFSSVTQSWPTLCNPLTAAHQPSLSITNSQHLLKLMSKGIKSVMPSNHLILYRPLLLRPSIFPSIRVFSIESVLPIRWCPIRRQSTGVSASASVLPMNIQD